MEIKKTKKLTQNQESIMIHTAQKYDIRPANKYSRITNKKYDVCVANKYRQITTQKYTNIPCKQIQRNYNSEVH